MKQRPNILGLPRITSASPPVVVLFVAGGFLLPFSIHCSFPMISFTHTQQQSVPQKIFEFSSYNKKGINAFLFLG